jgi:hypothetical protein
MIIATTATAATAVTTVATAIAHVASLQTTCMLTQCTQSMHVCTAFANRFLIMYIRYVIYANTIPHVGVNMQVAARYILVQHREMIEETYNHGHINEKEYQLLLHSNNVR